MTLHPLVSVVIPTRDRTELLMDCIASLHSQTDPRGEWEVIVVDDGDDEATRRAVAGMRTSVPLSYVAGNRRGLNSCRNAGITAARGDIIFLLDDDVICPAGWLSAFQDAAARHPGPVCFGGPIRVRVEGRLPRMCAGESLGASELDLGGKEKEVDYLFGGNIAITRAAFEKAGAFKESLPGGRNVGGEEMEWQSRLHAAGGDLVYVPKAWIWHRRLPADLRPTQLMKARYGRGRSWPKTATYRGANTSVAAALWRLIAGLAHAARHRCWGGLFQAGEAAGWALEQTKLLLSKRSPEELTWLPRNRG